VALWDLAAANERLGLLCGEAKKRAGVVRRELIRRRATEPD